MGSTPSIVSKRNDFTPADEFVEDAMSYLPEQYKNDGFRAWLLRYTETTIQRVSWHFATAAERGIKQAAELLCDPSFYETRRTRRKRSMEKMREQQAQQEWVNIERKLAPTQEQIDQQIKSIKNQVDYYSAQLIKYEDELERLQNLEPRTIHRVAKGVQ